MPASPFTGPVIAQAARSGVGTSLPGDGWPEAALDAGGISHDDQRPFRYSAVAGALRLISIMRT